MGINLSLLNDWLAASIRLAAPLMLTGAGGAFTERCGVFNIAMEGMMLTGAFTAIAISERTGSVALATLGAMIAGGLLGLVHAYITINRRANQIVTGAALNLFALGLTNLLHARLSTGLKTRVPIYPVLSPPALREVPFLGPVLFSQPVIIWVALVLPVIATWVLYRTSWGLSVRAVGEHSRAVATAGLSVIRYRYFGVLASAIGAGLGGSALALSDLGFFAPNMTAGRGFIVLAALAVGRWNPIGVAAACLLFGAGDALQLRVQALGAAIPYQFLVMVPYLLTIAVLAGVVGKAAYPKEAGKPYNPEEE